jgi:hypothetical protein
MSSAFAIAAVTAVLKDLLNNRLVDHNLDAVGNVKVTALPPDRIPVTSADEQSQLNLFLYQVTPNSGWRNADLPSRAGDGTRLTNPPLALDLHYLITAYGAKEFHAEVLLGYAMQLLHENPVLTRAMINATLKPSLPPGVTLPPGISLLSTSDLAEQIELIKICPQYLSNEELSRMWTALQAHYRPTAAYQISVVLIQETKSAKTPLPVLARGKDDRGVRSFLGRLPALDEIRMPLSGAFKTSTSPTTEEVRLMKALPSAQLGDEIALIGQNFTGDAVRVVFERQVTGKSLKSFEPKIVKMSDQVIIVKLLLPGDASDPKSAAGFYLAKVIVQHAGEPDFTSNSLTSNSLMLTLAPTIELSPLQAASGDIALTVTCAPMIQPDQRVALLFRDGEIVAPNVTEATDTLVFTLPSVPVGQPGEYVVRLRVDGVDSLPVDRKATTLVFADNQILKVP